MEKFRMLVLTDHSAHSGENSIYALLRELLKNPRCIGIDVGSRGNEFNDRFFHKLASPWLYVSRVDDNFAYHTDGRCFRQGLRRAFLRDYEVIFLRLAHPVSPEFWKFLAGAHGERHIINRPSGISLTGSKRYLLNFPEICPEMRLCTSLEDIIEFKSRRPIVLKPMTNYGGKGIVKIDGDRVWEGYKETSFEDFAWSLRKVSFEYLGMQYLKNVNQGDKRVVVVDGQVLGASLRVPPPGSWLCNAAQGGIAERSEADEDELRIAEHLVPEMRRHGILIFGFDTLVSDHGKRVLSEVNTTSIGGLTQIAQQCGRPIVRQAADLIWEYVKTEVHGGPVNAL